MLELADPAPVALRERVRGLLWVIGSLTRPEPAMARRWAARVADVTRTRRCSTSATASRCC